MQISIELTRDRSHRALVRMRLGANLSIAKVSTGAAQQAEEPSLSRKLARTDHQFRYECTMATAPIALQMLQGHHVYTRYHERTR